ncbi:hypothetical protein PHJA_000867000 [Phtheirospermum japonicum]|uniref:Uncharacterized protein n=1 Tax=Phtheirospermum japonicum TaxID=374723 RepID=A0A830BTA2_9LAMI|nr:hypothetical protein PHJA_000867000 [Phtheirospermum japonicum]
MDARRDLLDELMGTAPRATFVELCLSIIWDRIGYMSQHFCQISGRGWQICSFSKRSLDCTKFDIRREKRALRFKWDDKEACGCYMIRLYPRDLIVNGQSDLESRELMSIFDMVGEFLGGRKGGRLATKPVQSVVLDLAHGPVRPDFSRSWAMESETQKNHAIFRSARTGPQNALCFLC